MTNDTTNERPDPLTLKGWADSGKSWTEYATAPAEISEDVYYHFLEVLPPHRMLVNGFLVGEPYDHTPQGARYSAFVYRGGQGRWYYLGELTVKEFNDALGYPNGGEDDE